MDFSTLLYEIRSGVAVITLNRPDRLNAWNDRMAMDISDALAACDGDDDVRAVVITGSGRAFCAGADFFSGDKAEFEKGEDQSELPPSWPKVMPWHVRKPVLAAINGHAIGVGITFPMTCDIRFVAEDAKVQFAFVRRGILPELASHVIVPRIAGFSNAADLMLTGRMISGRELAAMGLASAALPADRVLEETISRARECLKAAPVSVAMSKRLLWEGITTPVEDMLRREIPLFFHAAEQPDAIEGFTSFLQKRDPVWRLKITRDMPKI
ncbi:MAG: enoyl-CoA hydratase-related protein [Thermodesulfobacteriota bacterium]